MLRKLRRIASLVCLFAAVACLGWGLWPPEVSARTLAFSLDAGQFPTLAGEHRLQLDWTPTLRAGDTGVLRLRLDVAASPGLPGGNVLVEARLDLPGVEARPEEAMQSALLPGRAVSFFWNLSAERSGTYPGKVWLYLDAVPPESADPAGGSQEELRRYLVSAPMIELRSMRLLGLSGSQARAAGSAGAFLGILLGIDWILERLKRVLPVKG